MNKNTCRASERFSPWSNGLYPHLQYDINIIITKEEFIQDFYCPAPQVRYPARRGGLSPGTSASSDGGLTSVSGLERLLPGRTAPVSF